MKTLFLCVWVRTLCIPGGGEPRWRVKFSRRRWHNMRLISWYSRGKGQRNEFNPPSRSQHTTVHRHYSRRRCCTSLSQPIMLHDHPRHVLYEWSLIHDSSPAIEGAQSSSKGRGELGAVSGAPHHLQPVWSSPQNLLFICGEERVCWRAASCGNSSFHAAWANLHESTGYDWSIDYSGGRRAGGLGCGEGYENRVQSSCEVQLLT